MSPHVAWLVVSSACHDQLPRPVIESLEPDRAAVDLATSLRAMGSFEPSITIDLDAPEKTAVDHGFAASVGAVALASVTWLDRTMLEVVIPPGLPVGPHILEVTAPNGQVGRKDFCVFEADADLCSGCGTHIVTDSCADSRTVQCGSCDTSPPKIGAVASANRWHNATDTSPELSYQGVDDPGGHVATIDYALGSTIGGTNHRDWTPAPASPFVVTGLTLVEGDTSIFSLRVTDDAGNATEAYAEGWTVDVTPPTPPSAIDDGTGALRSASTSPLITWSADAVDPISAGVASGVAHYQVALGSGQSGAAAADAMAWTDVGLATEFWAYAIDLADGVTYYGNLRARDHAGNVSAAVSSDGWDVEVLACPDGFALIPARPDVGVDTDFCAARYEMKAERDDSPVALCCTASVCGAGCMDCGYANCGECEAAVCPGANGDDRDHGCGIDPSTNGCVANDATGRWLPCCHRAESRAGGTPWVKISPAEASTECDDLGIGYALIANAQWMAIARHIEITGGNWRGGDLYGTELNRGHSDGSAGTYSSSPALAADGVDPWFDTGQSGCDATTNPCWSQRRVHVLSNGSEIWDLGGNVWEMMNDFVAISYPASDDPCWTDWSCWTQYNDPDPASPFLIGGTWSDAADNRRAFAPLNDDPTLAGTQLGGAFYGLRLPGGDTIFRGGRWDGGAAGGIYAAWTTQGSVATSTGIRELGFRCVYNP